MESAEFPSTTVLRPGIRTFKPRRGRITESQQYARNNPGEFLIDFSDRQLPVGPKWNQSGSAVLVDIGFGNGVSTIHLAEAHPEASILAIDVHSPGVGNLLSEIQARGITNIRVMETDAIAVLDHMIAPNQIAGVFTLFPDPWQKARHHKRRIVQPSIMNLMHSRLAPDGFWHIATDWSDYAESITERFHEPEQITRWQGGKSARSDRPTTHYEKRAIREGRHVTDFRFYTIK